ncbi:MAG TPA: type II secretion system protein [Phycisphaerae bacterium]|nr:type II secretion system protein [Phycisphaerae bacterium]HPS53925.1 type II secretion system protein [Phycisphaerae bacterium]
MAIYCEKRGFTLIELLVVISIISLLTVVLLPSMNKARQISKRTACRALLSGVGRAIDIYKGQYNSLPWARELSTITSSQTDLLYLENVPISKALEEFADEKQFKCPADKGPIGDTDESKEERASFGNYESYFERERTSYDYFQLFQMESTAPEIYKNMLSHGDSKILVMNDFEPFHGERLKSGSRNGLYGDGHVSDTVTGD